MRKRLLIAMAALAVLATGCSTTSVKPLEVTFNMADPAVLELNESALRVARASEQAALAISVGGKSKTNSPATREFKIDLQRLPQELREPVLLEGGFHGELDMFVRSISDLMAWKVIVVGNKPALPILVAMSEQRRPPAEWLADAGYQAGGRADVVLNPAIKQAVIKYKD